MPQRPTPKTKSYIPREFIECEICGQSYYAGYKQKHEGSERHTLCVNAINKYLKNFSHQVKDLQKFIQTVNSV